jgi:hypothetical protein
MIRRKQLNVIELSCGMSINIRNQKASCTI